MNIKKLVLIGVGLGIPLGALIGYFGVKMMDFAPELRPPFEAIMTPTSAQKIATDTFVRGAILRAQGVPENLRACEGVPDAASIFCFEGYWYAKVLDGLARKDKAMTSIPSDEKSFAWTGSSGVARDVYITAYGLALADAGQMPESLKKEFSSEKDYGHLLDGWVFMRSHAIGLSAAAEFCEHEPPETKPSCEFGVGRAAWFEKDGEAWIKTKPAGYKHGFAFAKNFTSQQTVSELKKKEPKEIGEKIAIIDKMLWMQVPAKDEASVKLYACQGKKHPADCASAHEGLIQ